MQSQALFQRSIQHFLKDAFVPLLDQVDEFSIGKVLVLHEEPHWYRRRNNDLDFSGLLIANLLMGHQACA